MQNNTVETLIGALVVAVAALASAFLVPAGQAHELAAAQEPAAPSGG